MFIVNEILGDLREVIGSCENSLLFRRIDAAMDLLSPMLPTDSNIGIMDVCAQDCIVTLPYEVEVPLAVNIQGQPADFRNKWYEHHLNGVGSTCCGEVCTYGWENQGLYPTFRDIRKPSYLFAFSDAAEPGTSYPSIKIFGEDINGKPLYSCQGDNCQVPGLILPITSGVYNMALLEGAPKVKKITQVIKPATCNFVRLVAYDDSRQEGTLIGYYRPEEQAPAYRRIKYSGTCVGASQASCTSNPPAPVDCCDTTTLRTAWIRMRYQRRQMPITSINDIVLCPSRQSVVYAVEAVDQFRNNNTEEGNKFMAMARAALEEKQESLEGPNYFNAQYPKDRVYGGDGIENMI